MAGKSTHSSSSSRGGVRGEYDESWVPKIKRRRRFSVAETHTLESEYENNSSPNQEKIQAIADTMLTPRKIVTTWFQNRRAKVRRREKVEREEKQATNSRERRSCTFVATSPETKDEDDNEDEEEESYDDYEEEEEEEDDEEDQEEEDDDDYDNEYGNNYEFTNPPSHKPYINSSENHPSSCFFPANQPTMTRLDENFNLDDGTTLMPPNYNMRYQPYPFSTTATASSSRDEDNHSHHQNNNVLPQNNQQYNINIYNNTNNFFHPPPHHHHQQDNFYSHPQQQEQQYEDGRVRNFYSMNQQHLFNVFHRQNENSFNNMSIDRPATPFFTNNFPPFFPYIDGDNSSGDEYVNPADLYLNFHPHEQQQEGSREEVNDADDEDI